MVVVYDFSSVFVDADNADVLSAAASIRIYYVTWLRLVWSRLRPTTLYQLISQSGNESTGSVVVSAFAQDLGYRCRTSYIAAFADACEFCLRPQLLTDHCFG